LSGGAASPVDDEPASALGSQDAGVMMRAEAPPVPASEPPPPALATAVPLLAWPPQPRLEKTARVDISKANWVFMVMRVERKKRARCKVRKMRGK
jgi:hypothetical protein